MRDTSDSSSPNDKQKKLPSLDTVRYHTQEGIKRSKDPQYQDNPDKELAISKEDQQSTVNKSVRDKQVIDELTKVLQSWQVKAQEQGTPHTTIKDLQAIGAGKPTLADEQAGWVTDPSQKPTDITVNMYHQQHSSDHIKQQEINAWYDWLTDTTHPSAQGKWAQHLRQRVQDWMPYRNGQYFQALQATYDEFHSDGKITSDQRESYQRERYQYKQQAQASYEQQLQAFLSGLESRQPHEQQRQTYPEATLHHTDQLLETTLTNRQDVQAGPSRIPDPRDSRHQIDTFCKIITGDDLRDIKKLASSLRNRINSGTKLRNSFLNTSSPLDELSELEQICNKLLLLENYSLHSINQLQIRPNASPLEPIDCMHELKRLLDRLNLNKTTKPYTILEKVKMWYQNANQTPPDLGNKYANEDLQQDIAEDLAKVSEPPQNQHEASSSRTISDARPFIETIPTKELNTLSKSLSNLRPYNRYVSDSGNKHLNALSSEINAMKDSTDIITYKASYDRLKNLSNQKNRHESYNTDPNFTYIVDNFAITLQAYEDNLTR